MSQPASTRSFRMRLALQTIFVAGSLVAAFGAAAWWYASRVLERNDMEVTTAKDGLDAVEKIQDRVPDLVLLDIEMPRMDGYEFATYMRNDPRLKAVPIIMITSRTGEKHRQRAMEIGVDRYLGKPYQEADLLRNVDEILRLTRAVH